MSGAQDLDAGRSEHTVSNRRMELAVAAAFMAFAMLVMYDNWRIGARWAEDGPQAGYFPFYIGVIMFIAGAATFFTNLPRTRRGSMTFVERGQLRLVLQVLAPTIVFALLIPLLGLYVAAALFIAFFMWRLGGYRWRSILPAALGAPAFLFLMFEVWFLVPLPKGPLEALFGY